MPPSEVETTQKPNPEAEVVACVTQPLDASKAPLAGAQAEAPRPRQMPSRGKEPSTRSNLPTTRDGPDPEIALLFAQIHQMRNAFWSSFGNFQGPEQPTRQRENVSVEAAPEPKPAVQDDAEVVPVEVAVETPEQSGDAALTLREFVSPAQSVFLVREDDWIEANTHGLTDVPLCDQHGQYIEATSDQPSTKTTLRVSSGRKYVQSLVSTVPMAVVTLKPTRRRR